MKAEVADIMKLDAEYKLFIGGKFVPASDGKTIETYCPATGDYLSKFAAATEQDVDAAVKAAREAFPAWAAVPKLERAAILNRIADALQAQVERFAMVECMDKGSPIRETTFMDMPSAIGCFRYFASMIAGDEDTVVTHDPNNFTIQIREPLGVVGQIIPWNFSFMIGAWKIAPALAAGNTIVMKPSSMTSLTMCLFAQIVADILPPGVFNLVTGSGSKTGEYILNHDGIDKFSFTGSTAVGYHIADAAAKKLIPATLELGGKSPAIYFDDCNLEKAIDSIQIGILSNAGQVCAATSRVFIQDTLWDKIVPQLVAKFSRVHPGMPWEMTTQLGSLIDEGQCKKVLEYIEAGRKEGKILVGGERIMDGDLAKGYYIQPTIIEGTNKMKCAQEEIFGPVVCFIKFHTEEEAVAMANDSMYGLGGAVWTKDINRAFRVAKKIESGKVWINTGGVVPNGASFGGFKKSGYGREIGKSTLEFYTHEKAIQVDMGEMPSPLYTQ